MSQIQDALENILRAQCPQLLSQIILISAETTNEGIHITIDVAQVDPSQRGTIHQTLIEVLTPEFLEQKIILQFVSHAKAEQSPPQPQTQNPGVPSPEAIPGVKKVIAVASGKGGVGKSAVSALLAVAFAKLGYKTGLIDADIYGPSQSQIFGVTSKPVADSENNKIIPIEAGPISLMSFSFFIEPMDPVIWRGPMIMKVLQQFFFEVDWQGKDILIIDLPPGTGDAQLSMAQYIQLNGGVIVTTPQTISVIDAVKGTAMFQKFNIPVLGVVENMSHFECPTCQTHHHLFQSGGAEEVAELAQADILARLPLYPNLCGLLDTGKVSEASAIPQVHKAFETLALSVAQKIDLTSTSENEKTMSKTPPPKKQKNASWWQKIFQK